MNVRELIDALESMPQDANVLVNYDHGVTRDLTAARIIIETREDGIRIHLCAMRDKDVEYIANEMKNPRVFGACNARTS